MYWFMSGERARLSCKKLPFVSPIMLGDEMMVGVGADYFGHEVSVNYSLESCRRG